jgi:AmpD protein
MKPSIDEAGWCDGVRRVASPNFDARPPGTLPELLVVHNISLPPGMYGSGAVEALFGNALDFGLHPYFETLRDLRVSAHFLIDRKGCLTQFVSCNERAWHAGASIFEGRERCNDFSIGIELEGSDDDVFENVQYATLSALTHALVQRYLISVVAGHSDIAPGRKTDPGPFFDWKRYLASAPPGLRLGRQFPA